jgi:hypothetical protein
VPRATVAELCQRRHACAIRRLMAILLNPRANEHFIPQ